MFHKSLKKLKETCYNKTIKTQKNENEKLQI